MIENLNKIKMFNLCQAYELISKELDMTVDRVIESFEWTGYNTDQAQQIGIFYHRDYQSLKKDKNRYKILIESVD